MIHEPNASADTTGFRGVSRVDFPPECPANQNLIARRRVAGKKLSRLAERVRAISFVRQSRVKIARKEDAELSAYLSGIAADLDRKAELLKTPHAHR